MLQELLDARSEIEDLTTLVQILLQKNEVEVAERFVRCISTIDVQCIENMLLSPQLLDMFKDMMNDKKKGTATLKKCFVEIFAYTSAS